MSDAEPVDDRERHDDDSDASEHAVHEVRDAELIDDEHGASFDEVAGEGRGVSDAEPVNGADATTVAGFDDDAEGEDAEPAEDADGPRFHDDLLIAADHHDVMDAAHPRGADDSGALVADEHEPFRDSGAEPTTTEHTAGAAGNGAHDPDTVSPPDAPDHRASESAFEGSLNDDRAHDLADAQIVDDVELFEADAADPLDAADIDALATAPADGVSADDAPGDDALSDKRADGTPSPGVPMDDASTLDAPADAVAADDDAALEADDVPAHDGPAVDEEAVPAAEDPSDAAGQNDRAEAEAPADRALTHAPWAPTPSATIEGAAVPAPSHEAGRHDDPASADTADGSAVAPATAREDHVASHENDQPEDTDETVVSPSAAAAPASAAGAATSAPETASAADPAPPTGPVPATRAERAATGAIGTVPLTRRGAQQADEAARVDRVHALERVRTPAPEVALTSKRIGQIDDARESSDLLTADRLLDPRQIAKPEPEGLWQQLVYSLSRHRINLGDGRRARERKDLDRRISAPLAGTARFVPVLSRKGGVGKTTVTSLLGMALADARDDRIIAVDANPDRGTLADRVGRPNGRTVRDLVRSHDDVAGYHDVSSIVARDATRLDVLASDADPRVSEAFSDEDYRQVADVAAHYYSIVLTDTGTGIVHSVMGATLELADTIVIVAGLSVDEARLASETLTWLETNGYAARVRDAVVVLNNSRPGTPLVRESELEMHFRSRVRTVIRMPYDARIAAGSAIAFRDLQPSTRQAARELAAAVVEGLRSPVAAA